jgi:hypothetical protein
LTIRSSGHPQLLACPISIAAAASVAAAAAAISATVASLVLLILLLLPLLPPLATFWVCVAHCCPLNCLCPSPCRCLPQAAQHCRHIAALGHSMLWQVLRGARGARGQIGWGSTRFNVARFLYSPRSSGTREPPSHSPAAACLRRLTLGVVRSSRRQQPSAAKSSTASRATREMASWRVAARRMTSKSLNTVRRSRHAAYGGVDTMGSSPAAGVRHCHCRGACAPLRHALAFATFRLQAPPHIGKRRRPPRRLPATQAPVGWRRGCSR